MYTYGNVIAICVSAAGSLCKDSSLALFGEGKAVKCTFSVYVYTMIFSTGVGVGFGVFVVISTIVVIVILIIMKCKQKRGYI